jgi:hypothetical protein
MQNILRIACSAGSIFFSGFAERVSWHADSSVKLVSRIAWSARPIISIFVAVIIYRYTLLVGVEEPPVRAF